MEITRTERWFANVLATLGGACLTVGWLLDINQRFGTLTGQSLVLVGALLTAPALVLLYWTALRSDGGRTGLIGTTLAAMASVLLVAITLPIVARALDVAVRETMESVPYNIVAAVMFVLTLAGWTTTGVAIFRSDHFASWTGAPFILGPLVVTAGGPTGLYVLTGAGFAIMGLAMMAAGIQLRPDNIGRASPASAISTS